MEDVRRPLALKAGHEPRLAEVDLEEDIPRSPGLDLSVVEAPGGGWVVEAAILRPGVWKRGGQLEVGDVTGLKAQRSVTPSAER